MRIATVVGNPSPGGRTTQIATAVARAVARDHDLDLDLIELSTLASKLFAWDDAEVAAVVERVLSADVAVIASPTYKASYTGLLKAFLDTIAADGAAGVPAVPVMVGGSASHSLAVEVHLRPLLVELGFAMPTRGLYVIDSELDRLDDTIAAWGALALPLLPGGPS